MPTSSSPRKTAVKAKTPAAQPKTAARTQPAAKTTAKAVTKASTKAVVAKAAPGKASAKPAAAPKEKLKKTKLVRDSFTMPETEYQLLGEVKKACIKAGFEIKKSELLRIGVALIHKTDLAQLKKMQAELAALKAGRPKKGK